MSTSISNSTVVPLIPHGRVESDRPQFHSWRGGLRRLLGWMDQARQRDALRAIADNKHLLNDIAISRHQVPDEADRPFWR